MRHRWKDIKRSKDDPERAARVEARVQNELRAEPPSCPTCAKAEVDGTDEDGDVLRRASRNALLAVEWEEPK